MKFLLALLVLFGCGDDGAATIDAGMDVMVAMDVPVVDVAADAPRDVPTEPGFCEENGLGIAPFQASATSAAYGELAGDFTINELDGSTFTLSEEWTGCESYVFINYFESVPGDALWGGIVDVLLKRSPPNVHYFFASYDPDPGDARARVESMAATFETSKEFLTAEEIEYWTPRVHFVADPLAMVSGSIGAFVQGQTQVQFSFAIDRSQRFDPVGSLAQILSGGFSQRIGMAAWAPHYFNYRFELDARLEAETDVTVVSVVDEESFTGRVFERDATLPSSAEMIGFDTLTFDVSLTCHLDAAGCSEWDRIAAVHVCMDDACDERRELVRWITPYSRPGRRRWEIDATPLLGLLREGGEQRFRIELGPDWEEATARDVQISARLSTRGGDSSIGAERAFVGGAFDDTYNAGQAPFSFTPPDGTTKVEIVTLVSGHGQADGNNCAEWCNHVHEFAVNGEGDLTIEFPGQAGQALGCAERAAEGVVPGQYGNWAPLRAGWCPGLPVEAVRMDITDQVNLAESNELTYQASFGAAAPAGGNIDLSVYIVYYR